MCVELMPGGGSSWTQTAFGLEKRQHRCLLANRCRIRGVSHLPSGSSLEDLRLKFLLRCVWVLRPGTFSHNLFDPSYFLDSFLNHVVGGWF